MEFDLGRAAIRFSNRRLSRRAALRGAAAGGLAATLTGTAPGRRGAAAHQGANATPAASPASPVALSDALLRDFEADVEAALATFKVPGAAVALVRGNEIVFNRGFGVRDVASAAPVTPRTRFRVGSITKSMTSLMLASLVDEGVVGWDDRAVDLWPAFRAPSGELTQRLRLRDLLGMGSGLAESADLSLPAVEFFMSAGTVSAGDVLRSVADQPVIAPPGETFSYNNTLVAAAAYLGLLKRGTPPEGLTAAFATEVRERVLAPAGMAEAAIADDPRPLGDDYAAGYARDIFGAASPLPFVSIGGVAPAGSGLASATDLARFLIVQMNGGLAPDGTRVVSAANLAELHRPGVDAGALSPPELRPDTVSQRYAMGWLVEEFTDGRRLLWHSGGIDGFSAQVGFFPQEELGFAILTNSDGGGSLFYLSVQASLFGRLFGLNRDLPAFLAGVVPTFEAQTAELAARTRPVDPAAVGRYVGLYEEGFWVRLDGAGGLRLDHDIRSMPLLALADGGYVVADGPGAVVGQPVAFAIGADGVPIMTIQGFAPVRWLTGG